MTIIKPDVLPICFFPTTVFVLDDDVRFTSTFKESLGDELIIKIENDPQEALESLNKIYQQNAFWENIVTHEVDDKKGRSLHLDLSRLYNLIYDHNRFKQIVIVITDYAMPKITGWKFSQLLKTSDNPAHPRIRIIVLTGELKSPAKLQSEIDAFYKKNEPTEKLVKKIYQFQNSYFQDASLGVYNALQAEMPNKPNFMSDKIYINFVQDLISKNKIMEFYLLDKQGSLLFLDKKARLSWLIVQNEIDMKKAIDFAIKNNAPSDAIENLKHRKMILYFPSGQQPSGNNIVWVDYLHPATVLEGDNKQFYFCSIVKDLKHHGIEEDKILSFEDYLESI